MADRAATRVVANTMAIGLQKAIASGLLVVWHILLARVLGPATYGVYGTIGAMLAVAAAIPDFGTGVIVVRDVARQPALAVPYLRASLVVHGLFGILAYGGLVGTAWLLGYDRALTSLLLFVGINLFVDAFGTAAHNQLLARERMWAVAAMTTAHVVLLVGLGAAAMAAGAGLGGVYVAMFTAGLLRAGCYWTVAYGRSWPLRWAIDWAIVRALVRSGAPLGLAAFVSLAFLHADKLAATAIVGTEATGHLTAAFAIAFGLVDLLGTTPLVASLPMMSRRQSAADPIAMPPVVDHLVFGALLLGLPATVLVAAFAGDLAAAVFGASFRAAAPTLQALACCIPIRMGEGALAQALTVRNRQVDVLKARAAGLVANVAVAVALLGQIGAPAAGFAMLAGETVIVGIMLWRLAPPVDWWLRLFGRTMRLAPAVVLLGGGVIALSGRLPGVAVAVVALGAYAGAAVAFGAIRRPDLALVVQAFRRPFES